MNDKEKLKEDLSGIHKPEPLSYKDPEKYHRAMAEWITKGRLSTAGVSETVTHPHNGDPNELAKCKREGDSLKALYFTHPYTPPTEEELRELQEWAKTPTDFEKNLDLVLGDLRAFLLKKNSEYGSSYERPLNVLLDLSPALRIKARMEEKLARLLAGSTNEDTLKDLVGLWVHLQIAEKDGSV
jgi:hypothetical protein